MEKKKPSVKMRMFFKLCLVFCVTFALYLHCIECRGRGSSRGRVTQSYKSRGSNSNSGSGSSGGSWFSWFKGGSSSSKTNAMSTAGSRSVVPPSLSHKVAQSPSHIGFAAYGNNYESNFHHNRPDRNHQFRPVSHPYQSHFQPRTTGEHECAC